jgi:ribosome biogenesis GTPase A
LVVARLMKKFPEALEKCYKIKADGDSEELIEKFGKKKGFMKPGGYVDEDKAAREILKDWQFGNIKV